MIRKSPYVNTRFLAIALACALLSACATTQRSSTSAADQDAASPQATVAKAGPPPASTAASPTSAAAQDAARPVSKSAAKADESGPMEFPVTNNAAETNDVSAQDAEMKRELAEKDAEIDKLRQAQEAEAVRMEQQATAAQSSQSSPGTDQANKPAAATSPRAQEEAVVFPARHDTAEADTASPPSSPKTLDHSVYFDYDDATVLARYDAMLLANAAYIKEHPDLSVEVQGNCDERGSSEYNLALGARRAEQVKRALEVGGANGTRIHTVSFGKEKPVAMGQDEASYSKNRRADIVF